MAIPSDRAFIGVLSDADDSAGEGACEVTGHKSFIRPIKFHGMRHTMATLRLKAGQPIHVVAERLGHTRIEVTLRCYAHVLPDMHAEAARRLSSMLYGG